MRMRMRLPMLDFASVATFPLGVAIMLLPVALHLWLGADNDSYLILAEGARSDPVFLGQIGLEALFKVGYLVWPMILIGVALFLRWLAWRWSPATSPREPARRA